MARRIPVAHVRQGADASLAGLEGTVDVLDADHHDALVELLLGHRSDPERVEPEPRIQLERLPGRVVDACVAGLGAEYARLVGGNGRPDPVQPPMGYPPERLEHAAAGSLWQGHSEPLGAAV